MSEQYKSFILERKRKIPELPCELRECIHEPSGARIIHLATDDPENVFCLGFKTLPYSSNGIAHVLEHLVLCGSKRFPVKDPFFSMTRRSMNTFMNAFTGTDFTCYPAASQIEKDFYNLLDVYIDAVFFPKILPLSFLQEAHRLEITQEGSFAINGVVYNEMKGALGNPLRRLLTEVAKHLFPDSPYGFNSGGDPQRIRTLTLEEVLSFHKTYYHPSQCLFFFYGNIPLKNHLDFLDEKLLSKIKTAQALPPLRLQPRFSQPKTSRTEYPISQHEAAEAPSFAAFSWLTTTLQDEVECLALSLLESMLFGTDASPVKYDLLQTRKCTQVSASLDTEIFEIPFTVVLSGCREADVSSLKQTLLSSLERVATEGLSQKSVETAMHELELAQSEITGDGAPFGLSLFWRSMPEIQHGLDPMKSLSIHTLFDELRAILASTPNYFSTLLRKYFLENTHFVEMIMVPSASKEEEEAAEERAFVEARTSRLSEKDKEEISHQGEELKKFQDEIQDLSCLPMLHLYDVPKPCRKIPLHQERIGSVDLFSHTPFTNEVCYTSLITPLPHIAHEDLWLLRLFSLLYTGLGCGNRTYKEMLDYLQEYTGGVYASVTMTPQATNPHQALPSWVMRGKCLRRNVEKMFSILSDFILAPRLDEKKRVREIIEKHGTNLHNSLQSMALDYALSKASAPLTPAQAVLEELYGLSYYKNIKELISTYTAKEAWLFEKLQEISLKVLHTNTMQLVYCGDPDSLVQLKETRLFGLADLVEKPFEPWIFPEIHPSKEDLLYYLPSKVSFTALSLQTVPYSHHDSPKLCLLSALMNNTFLHRRLREQGGAYGGGASAQTMSGTFSFYSYRDPNLFATLQAYEASLRWIQQGTFTEENIEEAKLSILQDLDTPIAPGNRAEVAYFWWRQGKTEEMRQRFKDLVRSTTKEELQALIPLYFKEGVKHHPFIALTNRELAIKDLPLFEKNNRKIIKKQV